MRTLWAWLVPLLASGVLAQGIVAEEGGFSWRRDNAVVSFKDGVWTAGLQGGRAVHFFVFLWHDDYQYESLQGGVRDAGPELRDDGTLFLRGRFSAKEGSAPMGYSLSMTPVEEGLRVDCTFDKTDVLKLSSGIWLHVFADDTFTGEERVWGDPSWHGTVRAPQDGGVDRLLIELQDGYSLCLDPEDLKQASRETYGSGRGMRLNILSGDFPVGQPAKTSFTISFDALPERFPGVIMPSQEPLALGAVTPNATQVPLFEKLELSVDLAATYQNPYDPEQVALDAAFTTPSGRDVTVPGFFMVRQSRRIVDDTEIMSPEGNGVWCVRFAPTEVGRYTWRLSLRDATGQVSGGEGSFEATAGVSDGFVRKSRVDPHYLAFDSGKGYFPVGHNLPIYHTSGQLGDEGMRRFAAAKENYNRWWMCSYGFGIEWMDKLGWYRQDAAARIDLSLDVAAELGLYYMMCMDTHQDFREGGWERNPFNAKNGGPCETVAEWFTNETAKDYYRKRLRYTVARWGYSPHVLCWEFGNEFEGWADSPNEIKLPWHREMADYLRSIDPFDHLITTSFWGHTGPPEFWALDDIDIVQTHLYTNNDGNSAEPVRRFCLHQWEAFDKPHIFGEFGIRSHGFRADHDPEGWGLHNSMWVGMCSLAAGAPMPWWHENYIDKLDLYFHFTSIADFAADLPFGTATWRPLRTSPPEYLDPNRPPDTRDAVILPTERWGRPEHSEFELLPDGTPAEGNPQQLLQGLGHRDLKNPPTFTVTYPQPGQFIAHIHNVSNSGLLRIWLDGEQVLEREFPCAEGLGQSSVYRDTWDLWETTYDEDVVIQVPAGRHTIRLENFGKDWIRVNRYTFTGCKVIDRPNLLVAGMQSDDVSILWLQNGDSSWFNHAGHGEVGQVDPCRLAILGLPDGQYELQWWSTWKAAPARTERLRSSDGRLPIVLEALATDVAVKIRPAD